MKPIQADFLKNSRGDAFIKFFDPAYVRSDIIILDRSSKSLYAVLHEQQHFIGAVDQELMDIFSKNDDIHLTAQLADRRALNLKVPLSIKD